MPPVSNDLVELTPRTQVSGRTLAVDFPKLQIGIGEYAEGPTGCTVFHFPEGVFAAADIRGGSYATMYTEQLVHGDGWIHAICLAGGSLYGLEAATGVAAEMLAQRDYSTRWTEIAHVAGAIIFDYGRRQNAVYPDKALGRAALRAARPGAFVMGRHGAGCSATVGKDLGFDGGESAGQGGALRQVGDVKVAVFSVVNAVGAIVDRQGTVVRGHLDRTTGLRRHSHQALDDVAVDAQAVPPGNTTLTLVVTNQKLGPRPLRQLAKQVHGSMARAIQPFHALSDGDVLYAVTTSEVDDNRVHETALGALASEVAWDAVLNCFDD